MNDERLRARGQGPEANGSKSPEGPDLGANSAAKPGSQGDKPDEVAKSVLDNLEAKIEKLTKENKSLLWANDRLVAERDKLSKKVAKLETRVENQITALKGKATEIANLKKKGGAKKMTLQHHH